MKRFLAFFLSAAVMISLVGCTENKYPPVESTEEEAQVVMKIKIDGEEYDVRYELYRALFLNNKSRVDGGDSSVWSGDDAGKYVEEVNSIIVEGLSEIYSVFHLAKQIGYDPYSDKADYEVEQYIIGAVEGDALQVGHGSYEAYLDSLKEQNLNYSVATLLTRYAMAEEAIAEYYRGTVNELGIREGEFEFSEQDVKDYYESDGAARFLQVYLQSGTSSLADAEEYRNRLFGYTDDLSMAEYIIGSTMATETDLIKDGELTGIVMGKHELTSPVYSDYVDVIFGTPDGQISEIVELYGSDADGYYIIYRLSKSDEHFERCYSTIESSYLDNIIGEKLKDAQMKVLDGVYFTNEYQNISHKDISMN